MAQMCRGTISGLSDEGRGRQLHEAISRESIAVLLQEDIKAAVEYAEGQIRRLLSGQVELWELPLTGGLWRVTGDWPSTCCRLLPASCFLQRYVGCQNSQKT